MHYLQKAILDKLRYKQPLAYTVLMPDGIESSHFRYHLKLLMRDGLVNKDAAGHYELSVKGHQEVDYLSRNRTTRVRMPKVITYTLLTHHGKFLLYKKPKQPYQNLLGLVGGKLHFGEDMRSAAQREVYEKTELEVKLPRLCGVADILIYAESEPMSHVAAYVHTAEVESLPATLPEELRLVAPSEVGSHPASPDLEPLLRCIAKAKTPFVEQIRCQAATV